MAVVNEQHGTHKWVQIHSVILLRFDFRTKTKENRCNEVCCLRSSFFLLFLLSWVVNHHHFQHHVCERERAQEKENSNICSKCSWCYFNSQRNLIIIVFNNRLHFSLEWFIRLCAVFLSFDSSVCMWFIFIKFMFAPLEWWTRELIAEKWPGCAVNVHKTIERTIEMRLNFAERLFFFIFILRKFSVTVTIWLEIGNVWLSVRVCVCFSLFCCLLR